MFTNRPVTRRNSSPNAGSDSQPNQPVMMRSNGVPGMDAQSGLARVQLLAGDSASANKIYSDMLSAPARYSDMQLLEAGVLIRQPRIAARLHAYFSGLIATGVLRSV